MYRIIKIDGTELGITDSVNYIKIGASGSYTPSARQDAIGVAFCSIPYNLIGYDEIEGAETVVVAAVDGGAEIVDLNAKNIEAEQMLTDLYLDGVQAQQDITEIQLQLLGG